MLDPQGFFFFGAIYRSSAWCCRFLSLNFYQWAALGPFEKPAGVRTMKQGCLYIWATKVIAVFTRNRISKKTSCHLKSCSPLLFFFFFFFSHWAVYLQHEKLNREEKKRSERFLTRFHAGVTHVQRGRRCAGIVPSALGGISLTPRLWLQLIKDQDTACWVCFINATVSVKPDSF